MSTDPATLNALAAEVEAGTGPDRDLDARIEDTIGPSSEYPGLHLLGGFTAGRKAWLLEFSPRYTASADAALGLMEQALPGCPYDVDAEVPSVAIAVNVYGQDGQDFRGYAPTLPLAIVAASLRAVAARGEG